MNLNGIQAAIFLLLTIDVIFHAIVIRYLMGIDVLMSAVKDEYLNIIKKEIVETVYWRKSNEAGDDEI